MAIDFEKCRDVLYSGLLDSLKVNAQAIRSLANAEGSEIDALSYEILPWHPVVSLSFRSSTDCYVMSHDGDYKINTRYSPPDWKYYQFITGGPLDAVSDYTAELYPLSGGTLGQEAHHVILLAAAHALLDEKIAALLQEYGLNATIRRDEIPWGGFEYLVIDEDKAFKANYCEFFLANRVADRLLGSAKWP
jgi:hypothetical protein